MNADLAVLYEHPECQKPLLGALERRGIRYAAVDLKQAVFSDTDAPLAPLYFNQASPRVVDFLAREMKAHASNAPGAAAALRFRVPARHRP